MNRRLFKTLTLWIVPLLIARALIPVCFMLSVNGGDLALTFCSVNLPAPGESEKHAAHMAHGKAGQQAAHDDANSNDDYSPCPFAVAAIAASNDVPYFSSATIFSDEVFEFVSSPVAMAGPVRADRIRGPPVHA